MAAARKKCSAMVDLRQKETSAALRKAGTAPEALFKELAGKQDRIPEDKLVKKLTSLEGSMPAEQAKLIVHAMEKDGVSRRRFLSFVQQFFTVVKEVGITDKFGVDSQCKTKRRLERDELVEVLEGPVTDTTIGLERIRGKSLCDGMEGWVTLKGNAGSSFLQEVEKPFYALGASASLENVDGSEVRKANKGEVIELLEGPKKEQLPAVVRVRGKALKTKDTAEAVGVLTLKDNKGVVFAETGKYYTCTSTVAITDGKDIKSCKVVRKLTEGEVFVAVGDIVVDEESSVSRVECKCLKDDVAGWVTIKGNAGTKYADASSRHYTMLQDAELAKPAFQRNKGKPGAADKPADEADAPRVLKKGQVFEASEAPREETPQAMLRVKGRMLGDGAVGSVVVAVHELKLWSSIYRCTMGTQLQESQSPSEDAKVVKELKSGETVTLLEGPIVDEKSQALRMKGSTADGSVGWATIVDADGKQLLRA
jgi:hypothetical protein